MKIAWVPFQGKTKRRTLTYLVAESQGEAATLALAKKGKKITFVIGDTGFLPGSNYQEVALQIESEDGGGFVSLT